MDIKEILNCDLDNVDKLGRPAIKIAVVLTELRKVNEAWKVSKELDEKLLLCMLDLYQIINQAIKELPLSGLEKDALQTYIDMKLKK